MSGPVETARAAWGDQMPEWVLMLANACADASQSKIATRMNRSASLVSAVLRNKYAGDLVAVEDVVRGVFASRTVECPALGLIPTNECRDWQLKARTFVNINSARVTMYRACNRCPRCRKEGA